MNLRNTAIWLVLFAALGIFAWSLRDSDPRQVGPNAPTATPSSVFDFEAEAVTAVRVEGEGSSYELTRDDADDWLVDGQAADDSVDSVVRGAADPSVLRVLPEDRDPEDYGFASPWLTVTFTVSDTQRQLFVGDEVPTSSGDRYVREGADGPMRTVSAFDLQRLQEWLTEPPHAPTPTPAVTATPEEGEAGEESEAEEGESEASDEDDADADSAEDAEDMDADAEADGGVDGAEEEAAGAGDTEEDADAGGEDSAGEADEDPEAPAATETPDANDGDGDNG